MHLLITGSAGFLGRRLATRLLQLDALRGLDGTSQRLQRITLVDVSPAGPLSDPRVHHVTGDISEPGVVDRIIAPDVSSVFHLAAVVSGMAEADFEIGMRVNVDASRLLLDACRARGHRPKFVFTSSVAVYGGALPQTVTDTTPINPQSSYGTQKAVVELLVNDYSRKGFLDGRVLRLPTISVRPGRPNAAASSFASGIIREPLNGEIAVCPVDPDTRVWVTSPRTAIECLIASHELSAQALGASRIVNVPGISVTVREMVAAFERVAGRAAVERIRYERDARIERIVGSWPGAWDTARAEALGFPRDPDFDSVIRQYVEELRA